MIVDAAVKDRELAAENILEELFARDHLAGGLQEHSEKIELGGGQIDQLAAPANNAGARIKFDIAGSDDFGGDDFLGRLAATEDRVYARDQFPGIERLWEVVVGPNFKPNDAVHIVAARGQHQHWGLGMCTAADEGPRTRSCREA